LSNWGTPVYRIHRLRVGDEEPILLEVSFIGKETVPTIERSIYRGDTYQFTVTATSR